MRKEDEEEKKNDNVLRHDCKPFTITEPHLR